MRGNTVMPWFWATSASPLPAAYIGKISNCYGDFESVCYVRFCLHLRRRVRWELAVADGTVPGLLQWLHRSASVVLLCWSMVGPGPRVRSISLALGRLQGWMVRWTRRMALPLLLQDIEVSVKSSANVVGLVGSALSWTHRKCRIRQPETPTSIQLKLAPVSFPQLCYVLEEPVATYFFRRKRSRSQGPIMRAQHTKRV